LADSFTHLHVHTEFSMLDGAARVGELVAAAASDGQPAIGITDHGNMYGILDFYKACRKNDVVPILGTEAYMAHESRHERPARRGKVDDSGGDTDGGAKLYYHLTLLAENNVGYKNLIQLSSRAYLEGYYYKPRVDWETLAEHSEGLIATTGCLGGHVLQSLMRGDMDAAVAKAARLQDIFGRDNLFVEIQDQGIPEQHRTNPMLFELARRIKAPLLATNDSHYVHQHDAIAHDALLCVQTGSLMSDPDRFKFSGDEHYLKTAAEMRYVFREVPESCDNTLWIAERCKVEIEFGKPQLPEFPLPPEFEPAPGETYDVKCRQYLEHLTFKGARERWGDQLPDAVVERLAYELQVIGDMGFSSYFLIVGDLIAHARECNIRVGPGRGSAAGCAVAYCLRITDLDPIKYDLLFERFLNPSRISMPDIDMDFDSRYRDEMIRYAAERYGRDHVAQIVTFSQIKARAAVRDAARVLGYPYVVGDKIAKAMPPLIMGRDTPLAACLELNPKFEDGFKMAAEIRDMYANDPDAKKVIDVARGLEGLRRQDGIHAAAVVITKDPLTEYLPIQRKPEAGKNPEDAPVVTQYEMHGVEELGLLKMDFLGLRNLDVISDTLELIERTQGVEVDIDNVVLDDPKTYELLCRGDTIGVFQLESPPMRALIRSMQPTGFEDVAALVALYRPGPMAANMHNDYADRKNGRQQITLPHDDAAEILGGTYGLCLAGDTRVFDARSGRPMRLDELGVVHDGAEVLLQGLDDEYRPTVERVTHWVCNGRRETFRLELANGFSVTGTANHPVLTYDGWKDLGSLTLEDRVAVPAQLVEPVLATSGDHDRLRVLGYLLGDGALSVRSDITFVNGSPEVLASFETSLSKAFPTVRCSRSTSGSVTRLLVGNGRGNGGGASPLLRWLRELGLKLTDRVVGGPRSAAKFVPAEIFTLDDPSVAVFLAALWDCDGFVGSRFAHLKTVSAQLAQDVAALLQRLGFHPAIYRSKASYGGRTTNDAFQVTVYDGALFTKWIVPHLIHERKATTSFDAVPRGTMLRRSEVIDAALTHTGLPRKPAAMALGVDVNALARTTGERHPWVHLSTVEPVVRLANDVDLVRKSRVQWVKVTSLHAAGEQLVYDITVENSHNFVANGMVVHNCVYQEQVMRIAQKFAGYSLAEADNLRKACGKKVREVMQKERQKFVEGCENTGYGGALGTAWFDIIEPFADYAFNKSHSYGYGYIAYQIAYLKANYPVEYLAALLTSVKTSLEKAAVYLNECRVMGIRVAVPDVNESLSDFRPLPDLTSTQFPLGTIVFGLSAVRNVGAGLVEHIVAERDANGPYTSFYDFCERVDVTVLNKRTIESLIKAGAFDSLGHPRKGLLSIFERIIDDTVARRREHDMGVMSLFGELEGGVVYERATVPADEFEKMERLRFEKEMLGLYISDHPLMGAEVALRRRTDCSLTELAGQPDGTMKRVGGVVTNLQKKWTKKGELMAVFVLEDLETSFEVMVFPRTMAEHGHKLVDDAIVSMRVRVDARDDLPKLIAHEVDIIENTEVGVAPPVRVKLSANALHPRLIDELKTLFTEHPGDSPVFLHLDERQVLRLPPDFAVDASNGLVAELRVLLGPDAILV
jgi:DNA polymerase-3 subunit alpha